MKTLIIKIESFLSELPPNPSPHRTSVGTSRELSKMQLNASLPASSTRTRAFREVVASFNAGPTEQQQLAAKERRLKDSVRQFTRVRICLHKLIKN
jgi:hypothetical protein